jgi:hypothetical protein
MSSFPSFLICRLSLPLKLLLPVCPCSDVEPSVGPLVGPSVGPLVGQPPSGLQVLLACLPRFPFSPAPLPLRLVALQTQVLVLTACSRPLSAPRLLTFTSTLEVMWVKAWLAIERLLFNVMSQYDIWLAVFYYEEGLFESSLSPMHSIA